MRVVRLRSGSSPAFHLPFTGKAMSPPPIWLMRQAGRYLPDIGQRGRARAVSSSLCYTPELASEVTLQPIDAPARRGDPVLGHPDVPHAMGLGLDFEAGEGPRIERPVRTAADIERLPIPGPKDRAALRDRRGAHDSPRARRSHAADRLRGQPVDGRDLRRRGRLEQELFHIKGMLYGAPRELHRLLDKLARATR